MVATVARVPKMDRLKTVERVSFMTGDSRLSGEFVERKSGTMPVMALRNSRHRGWEWIGGMGRMAPFVFDG
jgi:hypothetical protein